LFVLPRTHAEERGQEYQFNRDRVAALIDFMKQYGYFTASLPLKHRLPDLDDEPFFEVAMAGGVVSLVNGNKKDYPSSPFQGINPSPAHMD